MKMTNLALAASVFALSAARADGFTFTVGTEIPLGGDVDSTASINGVKVLIEDGTTLTAGSTYSLLTATTLTSKPEIYSVDSDGERVDAANGKAKNYWLAKVNGNNLRLLEGNPNSGLVIVFR